MEWQKPLEEIPDFRREHVFKEAFTEPYIAFEFICGADTDEERETYGIEKEAFLKTFLSLPHVILIQNKYDVILILQYIWLSTLYTIKNHTMKIRNSIIPSHDTITRVFRYLNKNKFISCLYKHSDSIKTFLSEPHISIDGKVYRATNPSEKKRGVFALLPLGKASKICVWVN